MHFFKKKAAVTVTSMVTSGENGSRSVSASSRISHDNPGSEYGTIIKRGNRCQQCCTKENLKEQALLIATIVSVILGIAVGIPLRGLKCSTGNKNEQ